MLHIKQDSEEIIPSFSDHESELLGIAQDRIIRRRSSKACDQCRRAKSKCLKVGNEPCQNCATLGVECTFLGPSRKRGPAKGYLSDLELKLHQMEALIGVLLSSTDPRAMSLVADISKDSAARDILSRVDTSLVGTHPHANYDTFNPRVGSSSVGKRIASELADSTQEWQRHLQQIISKNASDRSLFASSDAGMGRALDATGTSTERLQTNSLSSLQPHAPRPIRPPVTVDLTKPDSRSSSPSRRRRLEPLTPLTTGSPGIGGGSSGDPSASRRDAFSATHSGRNTPEYSDSEDLHDALGQLSLDDASQIRYHGKASGLHLLGSTERIDRRAEGGIWHFPPARVWPPTERPIERARALFASDFGVHLPTKEQQKMFLDLYFAHINPVLPLFDRVSFMKAWESGIDESSEAPPAPTFIPSRLPVSLMLVIFSIAMRLEFEMSPEPSQGTMSSTGDEYLSAAKYMMTANPYASSRPATCITYLLIAFREIGIGAMSQAWLFLGVAIRMAQDLGLHRSVDKFPAVASNLFSPGEKEARNRVWWGCVILDKYISTYIGRPCMIFERDYDTPLPVESPIEASETWSPYVSLPPVGADHEVPPTYYTGVSHAIAAFNASCRLSKILGQIVESLYSVKQVVPSRHVEGSRIENVLDTFYLELPGYLKYEVAGETLAQVPPPHILTLNMQYWNTVLLLHRPFIQRRVQHHRDSPDAVNSPADSETLRASASRAFELCKIAAGHVSRLSQVYRKNFCLRRSTPYLCYYVFNAGIMHVVTLNQQPEEYKETINHLRECMETLRAISTLWPSAGRAWELLNGCKATLRRPEVIVPSLSTKIQQHGGRDGYTPQYPQNRLLTKAQSLSHLGRRSREELNANHGMDVSFQSHNINSLQTPQSAYPRTQGFSPQQNMSDQIFVPWSGGSDTSFIRSNFDNSSPTHSRSASVGSHREPPGSAASIPHFWTDPFTDTSLLTSNYYGLPNMVDRRGQPISLENNLAPQGFGGVSYVPYEGTGF